MTTSAQNHQAEAATGSKPEAATGDMTAIRGALNLFASAIKSGERWTNTFQIVFDRAATALNRCAGVEPVKPNQGWREKGEPDPFGDRYDCPRSQIAGGHMTDDEVAYRTAMIMRSDLQFEASLSIAKDRIRWLSRALAKSKADLAALQGTDVSVQEAS